MTHHGEISAGYRVRQHAPNGAIFDLKTRDGAPLGYILNGTQGGPCLVVAGTGAAAKPVFQQVLFWPFAAGLNGRLALVLLDQLDDQSKVDALKDVSGVLRPVRDILLLPTGSEADAEIVTNTRDRIEEFCRSHGCLPDKASGLDCASI